jgi:branched-chain amino acid transport system ATP-binding protein
VLHNLLIGRHTHRTAGCGASCSSPRTRAAELQARRKAEEVIDLLDLQHHRDAMVAGLPYGVRKVVELARALCTEPRCCCWTSPRRA